MNIVERNGYFNHARGISVAVACTKAECYKILDNLASKILSYMYLSLPYSQSECICAYMGCSLSLKWCDRCINVTAFIFHA